MQVLNIQSSLRAADSVTRKLADTFLNELRAAHPEVLVMTRDLAASPIPHLPAELVPVQLGMTKSDSPAAQLAGELISELEDADVIVLGVPMYNFTVPSTVKAWLDHVIRGGQTFKYTEDGPVGLLPPGKRAIVFVGSGGVYDETSAVDFLSPYLRWVLSFVGIKEVDFVWAGAQANVEQGNSQVSDGILKSADLARKLTSNRQ